MAKFAVILPAAGRSQRFKHKVYKKPFAMLGDRAVWLHVTDRFVNRPDVKQVLVVVSPEDREEFQFKFGSNVAVLGIEVVAGGRERADSVQNALARVKSDIDYVCVHDAARPCLAEMWVDSIFAAAEKSGAAIFAIPINGTIKRVGENRTILQTVPREGLWEAQTPQVFRRELLLEAYAQRGDLVPTDEAQLVEQLGHPVTVVPGSPMNIKITTQDDLRLAEQALRALPKPKLDRPAHPFADDLWR